MRPGASSTRVALLLWRRPILAILPFLSPRSARYRGTRAPSTIVPPLISVSNSAIQPSLLLCLCFIPAYALRRKKKLSTTASGVSVSDKIFLALGGELGNTIYYQVSTGASYAY